MDSNLRYTKPFDYDFIDNEIINIRAKGGSQRLLWGNPDYMVQSGSSFACAHITGFDKAFSWSAVSSKLKPVNPELLKQQMQFFEKEIGIKVYAQSQSKELCEEIIKYLSEEENQ